VLNYPVMIVEYFVLKSLTHCMRGLEMSEQLIISINLIQLSFRIKKRFS